MNCNLSTPILVDSTKTIFCWIGTFTLSKIPLYKTELLREDAQHELIVAIERGLMNWLWQLEGDWWHFNQLYGRIRQIYDMVEWCSMTVVVFLQSHYRYCNSNHSPPYYLPKKAINWFRLWNQMISPPITSMCLSWKAWVRWILRRHVLRCFSLSEPNASNSVQSLGFDESEWRMAWDNLTRSK